MFEKLVALFVAVVFSGALSPSANAATFRDPAAVRPGDTVSVAADVGAPKLTFFDLFLNVPQDLLLISATDTLDPSQSLAFYPRFNSANASFGEIILNATSGLVGFRVTDDSGGSQNFERFNLNFMVSSFAPRGGDIPVPFNLSRNNGSFAGGSFSIALVPLPAAGVLLCLALGLLLGFGRYRVLS